MRSVGLRRTDSDRDRHSDLISVAEWERDTRAQRHPDSARLGDSNAAAQHDLYSEPERERLARQ